MAGAVPDEIQAQVNAELPFPSAFVGKARRPARMSLSSPDAIVVVAVPILAIMVLLWTGQIWARRHVTRWCEREGYELVEFRGAWFFEGPRAWLRTEDENAYHVEVRDRRGDTRTGYVVFGTW
jgi:ABC-type nickel/cobalt efflux system permease component RcnA